MTSGKKLFSTSGTTMLSARKVARVLGCAPDYVSRLCREGKLEGSRHQGAWYVEPASLTRYQAQREAARLQRAEALAAERRNETREYAYASKTLFGKAADWVFSRLPAISLGKHAAAVAIASLLLGGATLASSAALSGTYSSPQLSAALARVESPFFAPTFASIGDVLSKIAALFAPKSIASLPDEPGTTAPATPAAPTITTPAPAAPATYTTQNVINNTYPVIERTIETNTITTVSGISAEYFASQLTRLYDTISRQGGGDSVDFSDLTASDIPDLSAAYLPLAGGTLTGALNLPSLDTSATSTLAGLTLEDTDCSSYNNGGKLTTDSSGNVVCGNDTAGSGSGTPGGSDTYVQFNDGGDFGGDAGFTYNKTADRITVAYASTTGISSSYASSTNLFGGTLTLGSLSGVLKATGGVVTAATAGSDYENPLTFSAPLSRSTNTISITQAGTGASGYLASADFATFNNKISSSSLSAGAGISYNSATGVIQNTIGYPFPSNATTTSIAFNGGLTATGATLASTTLTGNFVFGNATGTNATTTNAYVSGTLTLGSALSVANGGTGSTTLGGILRGNGTGQISSVAIGSGLTYDGTTLATLGTAASSTLLADSNTWSGNNTFSNTITGSISGNAGTVTNGVYTTTFNSLFDPRFITQLAATTSVASITTLSNLSILSAQVSDLASTIAAAYPFPSNATSTLITFSGGLTSASTTLTGPFVFANATGTNATTTSFFATVASSTNLFSTAGTFGSATAGTLTLGSALSVANGGTGLSSLSGNSIIYTNSAGSAFAQTSTSTLSIGGNAGTVTDGVYTTTFNSLFDPRFVTDLAATTSVASITTLPSLSLPYVQLTGTPSIAAYPFPSNATSTLITFSGGLTSASTTLTGPFVFANATGTNATTTNLSTTLASTTALVISSAGGAGTRCLQVGADGTVSANVSACGTGSGASEFTFVGNFGTTTAATSSALWAKVGIYASSTSQLEYASTTALSVSGTLWGANLSACDPTTGKLTWSNGQFGCGTDANNGGGGGSFPFSPDTNYGQLVYSTTTPSLWFRAGFFASSTSYLVDAVLSSATSSALAVTGSTTISSVLNVGGQINANGGIVGNLTGDITGNAGTVTNGVYTTTFNSLFDPRFITQLAATTSVASITTLSNLSILSAQVSDFSSTARGLLSAGSGISYDSGTGVIANTIGYPFTPTTFGTAPASATTTLLLASGGFAAGSSTLGTLVATSTVTLPAYTNGALAVTSSGVLYTYSTSTWAFASSTLLADSNTWSGNNTFSNTITGSISGNAGTVTNGVYTTTFNSLFDPRFITQLAATTSVASITTLSNLSILSAQVSDLASTIAAAYPFPSNATSTLITFSGGLTSASTTLTGPFVFANATGTNATTTSFFAANLRATGATTSALAVTGSTTISSQLNALGGSTLGGTVTLAGLSSSGLAVNAAGAIYAAATTTFSGALAYANGNVTCNTATASTFGCLASTDWSTFNNKISSTSLSGGSGISYNSSTGVITNTIGYPFVGDATSTLITFSGGLTSASTTLTGPFVFANATGTNATTSTFTVTGVASTSALVVSGIPNALLKTVSGGVVAAVAGTDYLTSADIFAYPFPSNATSTLITFSGGLTSASTTLTGPFVFANATGTNATTTSLAISNISSGSLLKATTGGSIIAAVAGTDYATLSNITAAYPFTPASTFGTSTSATSTSLYTAGVFFASSTAAASQFPYASSTALSVSGIGYFDSASTTNVTISSLGANAGQCLTINSSGVVTTTPCDGNSFAYPFPSNATSTLIAFNGGLTSASTTLTGSTTLQNATTTTFAITGVANSLLKTLPSGSVVAASAGSDYEVPLTFTTGLLRTGNTVVNTIAYPFPNNSTSTLITFHGGLTTGTLIATSSAWLTNASTSNLFASGTLSASEARFGATASTTIDAAGNLVVGGNVNGAGLVACSGTSDKLLWDSGQFSCGIDLNTGGGGGNELNWTFFNGSAIRLGTTTNQVLIGLTATTSQPYPLAKLMLLGGAVFDSASTTSSLFGGTLSALSATFGSTGSTTIDAAGNVGIGTSSPAAKLALSGGNLLQVASGNPTLSGSLAFTNTYATVVSGRYAYSADLTGGLRITDVSNPHSPALVSSYAYAGGALAGVSLAVAGKYAYVGDNNQGLVIIDVSNPQNPTTVGSANIIDTPWGLALSGKYVYAVDVDGDALKIIDVSDPTAPTLTGSWTPGGTPDPYSVVVSGKYAYVGDFSNSKVYIVDISNPKSPATVGEYSAASIAPVGLYVSGRYLYVADAGQGFYTLDISDPTSPSLVGTYDGSGTYYSVTVAGSYAYLAKNSGSAVVVDVSNPAAPATVGSYATGGTPFGISVSGKYAYVSVGTEGLQILDINGATLPAAHIGALESNTANISDTLAVGGDITAGGGLSVGISGIFSRGTIAAYIASSTQVNPVVANFMGGNVGIGTTSPYRQLSVGSGAVFGADVLAAYFTATSTTVASTFPYASTTALTVSGTGYFGTASTTNLRVSGTQTFENLAGGGLAVDASGAVYKFSTSTWAFASSTLLADANTFSGVNLFTNASSNFAGTWQGYNPGNLWPFPSNATTTQIAFNGGATFAGATSTAGFAVTGSTTISAVLNVGGTLNANGALTVVGNTTLAQATSTNFGGIL